MPNARDPWGVLKNVPGVLLDRVNIAGNENGQQASAAGKGSTAADKMWNLDGLVITDMSATGASPTYFDFDAFQEINVTTGGADLADADGRHRHQPRDQARHQHLPRRRPRFLAHDDLAARATCPTRLNERPAPRDPDGTFRDKADHIQQISDYGFDLGGPIVKDKLWFYGSWGKQDIRLTRLIRHRGQDPADLVQRQAELAGHARTRWCRPSTSSAASRSSAAPRASGQRADDFLWNQDNAYTRAACRAGSGS